VCVRESQRALTPPAVAETSKNSTLNGSRPRELTGPARRALPSRMGEAPVWAVQHRAGFTSELMPTSPCFRTCSALSDLRAIRSHNGDRSYLSRVWLPVYIRALELITERSAPLPCSRSPSRRASRWAAPWGPLNISPSTFGRLDTLAHLHSLR
jgi:hypothetical protein